MDVCRERSFVYQWGGLCCGIVERLVWCSSANMCRVGCLLRRRSYEGRHDGKEAQRPADRGAATRRRVVCSRCAVRGVSRRRAVIARRGRGIVAATFRRLIIVVIGGGPGHGGSCRSGSQLRHVAVAQVAARADAVADPVGHLAVVD